MLGRERDGLVAALTSGQEVDLTPREAALVAFAGRLTRLQTAIRAEDVADLREAGLDDRAVHDAVQVVAYFAYVNRVVLGLGIELEAEAGRLGHAPGDPPP